MSTFQHLAPDLILSVGGTLVLLAGAAKASAALGEFLRWFSVIIVAAAAGAFLGLFGTPEPVAAEGWIINGSLNIVFAITFLVIIAWAIIGGNPPANFAGEWYSLLLFTGLGMIALARSGNIAILFLGVEVLSLALYVLISFRYTRGFSIRAGTMYLVLAGFASGFLLFGLALLYATYGSLEIAAIQQAVVADGNVPVVAMIGFGLFLVGVSFKLSLVPFHMWAPEVYEAAPGAISGVIASASKGAIVAAFIPFIFMLRTHWQILWILSLASMLGGNLLALRENRVKRILAYSSIGHIGYMMIGYLAGWSIPGEAPAWAGTILAWDDHGIMNSGVRSMAFYIIAYAGAILGAFLILSLFDHEETVTVRDLRGVAKRRPVLAFCMTVFVISLAGLPPTAGFFGKLYLFAAGVAADYVWLAILGLVASAIGIFYYLRIIVNLYMLPPDAVDARTHETSLQVGLLVVTAAAVVLLGIFPDSVIAFLHPR